MPTLNHLFEEVRSELMADDKRVTVMVKPGKSISSTERVKCKCPGAGHFEEQRGVQCGTVGNR